MYEIEKKRKLDCDYDECENAKQKIKWGHPLIYTRGTTIHFSADINKISINLVIKEMSKLIDKQYKDTNEDTKVSITYVVDTPGGSVHDILKFVDFVNLTRLKYSGIEFVSVITGLVASAGTIMAIVADKRLMTANAHAMIHEMSSGNSGRYTQMMAYAKFMKNLNRKLENIYLSKVLVDKKKLKKLMMKDTWYTAEEYLKYGFIDEIK